MSLLKKYTLDSHAQFALLEVNTECRGIVNKTSDLVFSDNLCVLDIYQIELAINRIKEAIDTIENFYSRVKKEETPDGRTEKD